MILNPIARWARQAPGRLAVIHGDRELSVEELEHRVRRTSCALKRQGVANGDRIAVVAHSSIPYIELIHALPRLGAVLVPLSTRLTSTELGRLFDRIEPILTFADADNVSKCRALPNAGRICRIDELAEDATSDDAGIAPHLDPDALHAIMFTSGSTGSPKGVMLTWGNHAASAEQSARNLGVRPDDRWLASLPFYHAGGLAIVWRAAIDGTTAVVCDNFEAATLARAIDKHRVTLISLVGETLRRLIDAAPDGRPPASLRAILLGGGPVDPALRNQALESGWPILSTYGMTETASQIATQSPHENPGAHPDSAPPLHSTEIDIRDADGLSCPTDEPGEITVRGPTVMQGYLDEPDATAAALYGGWLYTGDRGVLGAGGRLHVTGRIDDLIISGAENIEPAEIVAALRSHSGVRDAAVIAVPDSRWGQRPAACVEIAPDAKVDRAELRQFLRHSLAGFKVPDRIAIVGTIPRLQTGKPDREAVRLMLLQEDCE